jgi:hypothetical protein
MAAAFAYRANDVEEPTSGLGRFAATLAELLRAVLE